MGSLHGRTPRGEGGRETQVPRWPFPTCARCLKMRKIISQTSCARARGDTLPKGDSEVPRAIGPVSLYTEHGAGH